MKSRKGEPLAEINKINMKHNEANVMNDKIFEILWKKKIPSIPRSLSSGVFPSSLFVVVVFMKQKQKKKLSLKTKKF
jgi:hypothetical protein